MEYLLAIGLAMFAGLFLSRLTSRFNLPDVTSYLVAGLWAWVPWAFPIWVCPPMSL